MFISAGSRRSETVLFFKYKNVSFCGRTTAEPKPSVLIFSRFEPKELQKSDMNVTRKKNYP